MCREGRFASDSISFEQILHERKSREERVMSAIQVTIEMAVKTSTCVKPGGPERKAV